MLKQGSVSQLRRGELTKADGYLVIAMAFYPRGLKKDLWDEYRSDLAPGRDLFKDWKEVESHDGHDAAFQKTDYEGRFQVGRRALEHLESLAKLSRTQDVYLICQCEMGERCHREILLLLAQQAFQAPVSPVFHSYEKFMSRVEEVLGARIRF